MDLGISGKLALVTGASRGIGKQIVSHLLDEGVSVVATSRSIPSFEVSSNYSFVQSDLSTPAGTKLFLDLLSSQSINPDIVVNNVGGPLASSNPLESSSSWVDVSTLNITSAMLINESLIPSMISKSWGRICHISSISSIENQGTPSYCAAKAALNAYVRSLGRYVAKDNVILTSVLPGAVLTEDGYWDHMSNVNPSYVSHFLAERISSHRFGTPEEIAKIVMFLVSNLTSFCPGASFLADGGQGRSFEIT